MKIEVSISDGSMEEQQRVTAFIYKSLNALREKQRQNGEACTSYEIKTSACRGVISVGWREDIEAAKQPKKEQKMKIYNITATKKLLAAINEFMPEFVDRPDIFTLCGILSEKLIHMVNDADEAFKRLGKDRLNFDGLDFSQPIAPENVVEPEKPEENKAVEQPKAGLRTELVVQTYEALSSTIKKLCGSPTRSNELCQSLRVLSEVSRALGQMDGQETSR